MTPLFIERLEQDGLRFYLDSRGALRWKHVRRLTTEERAAVVKHREEIVLHTQRAKVFRQLQALYDEQAEHHGAARYRRLRAIPGWETELHRLEEAFNTAWRRGEIPTGELAALRGHWWRGLADT